MNDSRMDDLLDEFLVSGTLPETVTREEREEVLALTAALGPVQEARATAETEARLSTPIARARFESFVAGQEDALRTSAAPAVTPPIRRGWWSRTFGSYRAIGTAGAAAALGLVALIAVLVSQGSFGGAETASALTPGDYAQLSGVITDVAEADDGLHVTVAAQFEQVKVLVSPETAYTEPVTGGLPPLTAGRSVLIAGIIGQDRIIAAQTLSLADRGTVPAVTQPKALKAGDAPIEGVITLLTLGPEGKRAKVVVETASGRSFLVTVTVRSAGELLQDAAAAVGVRVRVTHEAGDAAGLFRLTALARRNAPTAAAIPDATPPAAGTPEAASSDAGTFVRVQGVILSRVANVLRVQTERGIVAVVIRAETTILLDESGLTREGFAAGETLIGHTVTVSGGLERPIARVVADVIVVGPKER
ncbi:hypothetical protein AYO38_04275 [bacterium SCGC AG-212-C10]|nr:hypothetical protein AYO38_04275 [bacterium SCGC AG-212-C10]